VRTKDEARRVALNLARLPELFTFARPHHQGVFIGRDRLLKPRDPTFAFSKGQQCTSEIVLRRNQNGLEPNGTDRLERLSRVSRRHRRR
jgi:hypothetical protein